MSDYFIGNYPEIIRFGFSTMQYLSVSIKRIFARKIGSGISSFASTRRKTGKVERETACD